MSEGEKIRAFIALPCDSPWVESARGLVARLEQSLPRASWTKPASWHLTLKFFEQISREQARALGDTIGPIALETTPGEIATAGAVVFPPRGPARVLAVGFAPSPILEGIGRLVHGLEAAAHAFGLSAEKRAFHPHITLARLRQSWPADAVESFRREVGAWSFPNWQARSCVLYESRLLREGAVHTPLEEWSFVGGPRGVRA